MDIINENLEKAVYYFRVSSPKQAERETTIAHYVSRGEKAGFKSDQILYDVGSGGSNKRESYQVILSKISKGEISKVYLPSDLSRLLRDVAEFKRLQKVFTEAKVQLLDLTGNEYKFEEPEQILISDVQMSFYEFERNRNKHKAIMGHKYLRDNGKAMVAVFPYIKQNGVLYPNTSEYKNTGKSVWLIAQELIDTYIDCGSSNHTINRMTAKYGGELNGVKKWEDYSRTAAGLTRWLRSEYIRGNLHYKTADAIAYGTHKALVTDEKLRDLDKVLSINNKGRDIKKEIQNLWQGIAFCECGAHMRVHAIMTKRPNWSQTYKYVVCSDAFTSNSKRLRNRRLGLETAKCNRSKTYGLTVEKMEDLTINALMQKAEDIPNSVFKEPEQIVSKEVQQLQEQIEKYKLLAEDDEDLIPVLNKKQLQLNKLIEDSKTSDEVELDYLRKSLSSFGRHKDFWDNADKKQKMFIFREFISNIICIEGTPHFTFKV
jgi:DNA invertase Pin-like site-specific DNA recombinase